MWVVASATSINPFSALLTASSFGNASATSGSSTTMVVCSARRAAYFPLTSVPKSERLYSDLSSSTAFRLAFFIDFPFLSRRQTSTYDADDITFLGVRNDQEAALFRNAKCYRRRITDR